MQVVVVHEPGDAFAACLYSHIGEFRPDAGHAVGFVAGTVGITDAL
jgi:hypothetical protein